MTDDRIVRRPELQDTVGLTERQVRNLENEGRFPKRFLIAESGRAVGWSHREIQQWVAERLRLREQFTKPGMLTGDQAEAEK